MTFLFKPPIQRPTILESLGVQLTYVAHLKAPIALYWNLDKPEPQRRGRTLTMGHVLLKKAIS